MTKWQILIIGAGIIMGTVSAFFIPMPEQATSLLQAAEARYSRQPGVPRRLVIPDLKVDVPVEAVGKDAEGRMGVPGDALTAGWYKPGFKPGEKGHAVIDGHVNTPQLKPAIFAHLNHLQPGQPIMVEDDKGKWWDFGVERVELVVADPFPVTAFFGPAKEAQLHLITCSGTWDRESHDYTERVVVTARLIKPD